MSGRRLGTLRVAGLAALVSSAVAATPATPPQYQRDATWTYWGPVRAQPAYLAKDYASHIAAGALPSEFPHGQRVTDYWTGYAQALPTALRTPASAGAHLQAVTDASLGSMAQLLRSAYELSVGRLAELSRQHGPTEEERLAARLARDYADAMLTDTARSFDHFGALRALWQDTGATGPDLLRKWERKYLLTTEYGARALAAWTGRLAARMAPASLLSDKPRQTAVVVDRWVDRVAGGWPEMQRVRSFADGGELVLLPSGPAFRPVAMALARSGANFMAVAGNGAAQPILLSVLAPAGWQAASADWKTRSARPLPAATGQVRVVLEVPVGQLAQALRAIDGAGLSVEQIYDY